jgi:hypothetical protein
VYALLLCTRSTQISYLIAVFHSASLCSQKAYQPRVHAPLLLRLLARVWFLGSWSSKWWSHPSENGTRAQEPIASCYSHAHKPSHQTCHHKALFSLTTALVPLSQWKKRCSRVHSEKSWERKRMDPQSCPKTDLLVPAARLMMMHPPPARSIETEVSKIRILSF